MQLAHNYVVMYVEIPEFKSKSADELGVIIPSKLLFAFYNKVPSEFK